MAEKITFMELEKLVVEGDITEKELGSFFEEHPELSYNLDPTFLLDTQLVELGADEAGLEGAGLLNVANKWCRRLRQKRYRKKVKRSEMGDGPPLRKIVAEGDSWFQYPFRLHDVIDHLMDEDDLAVLCFSEAGDVLSRIVQTPEFMTAIREEEPEFFLVSGSGNDLVDGPGLRRFLFPFESGRQTQEYFRPEYEGFKGMVSDLYTKLFSEVVAVRPEIKILCHGYSYPIPNDGKWLGKPMSSIGIVDNSLQRDIMTLVLDDVNDVIKKCAAQTAGNVRFVDVLDLVPPDGWHDEFHPKSDWFGQVASRFRSEM